MVVYCTILLDAVVYYTALLDIVVYLYRVTRYSSILHYVARYGSILHRVIRCGSILYRVIGCGSIPHLSRYHTLHVTVRGLRIWPPNAAKCCKNTGKFFPDVEYYRSLVELGSV
jgi:hypothetical protein